jgi:hypothetical protein
MLAESVPLRQVHKWVSLNATACAIDQPADGDVKELIIRPTAGAQ